MSRRTRQLRGFAVPVFAATGADAWGAVQELRGNPGVRLMPTPRHAAVLLIAGTIPDEHRTALQRVHDQTPHPRAAVSWRTAGAGVEMPVVAEVDGAAQDVVAAIHDAFARLLDEPARSVNDLLSDRDPNEWRGVGPFGQGGEGMMGGTPYGRPMAMTADDRDGLALDELHLTLGPFLDAVPAALTLDIALQGDVVRSVALRTPETGPDVAQPSNERRAPHGRGSARRGAQWLSHALHVQGLDALAARAARLAAAIGAGVDEAVIERDLRRLGRWVRWSGVLRTLDGVGAIDGGLPESADHLRGDAAGRWRRRLAAIQEAVHDGSPHPALAGVTIDPITDLVEGVLIDATLADAVTTIASLDVRTPQLREVAAT